MEFSFDCIDYNYLFIDGVCASSVVTLIISVPKIEDKTKQRFGVYVINFIILIDVYLLLNLYLFINPLYSFGWEF
jgi:hypothetical protein